jgi:MHS family proline/betaine transporter-like MFS transporter
MQEEQTATIQPIHYVARRWVQMTAAMIGVALETFDTVMYGYLAVTLSGVFFPARNPTISLLLVFVSFGLPYVVRPLGAAVLGAYGDRRGRKKALTLSIQLMMAGTAIMALMPPFAMIGLVAPIGVFTARLLQAFSFSGEVGSSTAFMAEQTKARKGFYASWLSVSQKLGLLLAALFGLFLTTALAPPQLNAWGWRLPFFFGLLVGPVGLYIRRHVQETPEFVAITPLRAPVREVFSAASLRLLLGACMIAVPLGITSLFVYLPTFATRELKLPAYSPFYGLLLSPCLGIVFALTSGRLSDTVGRIRIMLPASVLALISFYPVFALLVHYKSVTVLLLALVWLSMLQGISMGPAYALMSEIFPTQIRSTGMSLSYNVGVMVFGGFGPVAFAALIAASGTAVAPSFYLVALAFVSVVSLFVLWRKFGIR